MTTVVSFPRRLNLSLPSTVRPELPGVPADGPMPRWWQVIAAYLEAIGHEPPHTAGSDYDLVRSLAMGRNLADIAESTHRLVPILRKRWAALTAPIRTAKGVIGAEEQSRLLLVLKHRAGL